MGGIWLSAFIFRDLVMFLVLLGMERHAVKNLINILRKALLKDITLALRLVIHDCS